MRLAVHLPGTAHLNYST